MAKTWLIRIILGVVALEFALSIISLMRAPNEGQWDFRTYYSAAKVAAAGQDPYDFEVLEKTSGTGFYCAYPPAALWFYRLFLSFDYEVAARLFLFLKCGLLLGLMAIWTGVFLRGESKALFFLFCLLAFNRTISLDLAAGNISILEQFLIWAAFAFYVKRRFPLFCLLIVLAASVKMLPILFLFLVLAADDKRKYAYFGASAAAFFLYLSVQYVLGPRMFMAFLKGASRTLEEGGIIAPSTLAFLREASEGLAARLGIALPVGAEWILFGLAALAVLSISSAACFALRSADTADRGTSMIFFACAVYAIIHPRFKDYSFILLLVPSYAVMKRTKISGAFPFLFLLSVLPVPLLLPTGAFSLRSLFWNHYPLLIAYGVWAMYVFEFFGSGRVRPGTQGPNGAGARPPARAGDRLRREG